MNRYLLILILTLISLPDILTAQEEASAKMPEKAPREIFGYSYYSSDYNTADEVDISIKLDTYYLARFSDDPEQFEWRITGLPDGARFNYNDPAIIWDEEDKPLGKYTVRVEVRYKDIKDSKNFNFEVVDDMESAFLPALGYSMYTPKNQDETGKFAGASVQFAIISWIHRNDNRGPCYGQWYLALDMLETDLDDGKSCFIYGTGLDLSFERNPSRSWLLPYFGAYLGWISQDKIGNRFLVAPEAGVWLWADRNLFVNTKVSYLLPTSKFEDFQGMRITFSINYSLW